MRTLLAIALLVPALASAQTRTIVIDAGHGGTDPGGVGTGLQEKNIVLDVTLRFRDLLVKDTADAGGGGSWKALLTRGDDTFVGLSARAAYANAQGADRFMSIHSNAFSTATASGTETFAFAEGGTAAALRNLVQDEMIKAWGLTNRGNKVANFAVLRETSMAAELHELAFITNANDAKKLASATERQKAAEAHLRAIQRHFGIAPYIPGGNPPPQMTTGEVAGRVLDSLGPLADATVTLAGRSVTSDLDGNFAFTGVAVGEHELAAHADGFMDRKVKVTVKAGQRTEVELQMEPLDVAARIAVFVHDAGGRPIDGALVAAGEADALTDAEGRTALIIPPGRVEVVVSAEGYDTLSKTIDAVSGEQSLDLTLGTPGGKPGGNGSQVAGGCSLAGASSPGSLALAPLLLLLLALALRRSRA
jgi:N-acetylmuramoyl-L-alanine amidase